MLLLLLEDRGIAEKGHFLLKRLIMDRCVLLTATPECVVSLRRAITRARPLKYLYPICVGGDKYNEGTALKNEGTALKISIHNMCRRWYIWQQLLYADSRYIGGAGLITIQPFNDICLAPMSSTKKGSWPLDECKTTYRFPIVGYITRVPLFRLKHSSDKTLNSDRIITFWDYYHIPSKYNIIHREVFVKKQYE